MANGKKVETSSDLKEEVKTHAVKKNKTYVVNKNEKISDIATKLNISVGRLMKLNDLSKYELKENQELKISE